MSWKHWCAKCDVLLMTETKTGKRVIFKGYDAEGNVIAEESHGAPFCPECGEEMITCEKVQP